MLQLSKKVEYALIALRHMAMNSHVMCSRRKKLQPSIIFHTNFLRRFYRNLRNPSDSSTQGMRGGYSLEKKPDQIQVSYIINVIEEEKTTITNVMPMVERVVQFLMLAPFVSH